MNESYCRYCCKYWKLKKEYDNHLTCCLFFYQYRTDPTREMTDFGVKVPSQKELFALVYQLSLKCDRLEKEVKTLKNTVSTRQRKMISEWINLPSQLPTQRFDEWWREMTVTEEHLKKVFRDDLTEGMKMCIESQLKLRGKTRLPIRAFVEKPSVYYIYAKSDEDEKLEWRIMLNRDMERMTMYLSQLFIRVFLDWQSEHEDEMNADEDAKERMVAYMVKVNGLRVSTEKRIADIKKWMFPLLQESVNMVQIEW